MNFSARYLTDPKFKALLAVARLDKPVGTLLLLWPTLWALWLSGMQMPPLKVLLVSQTSLILNLMLSLNLQKSALASAFSSSLKKIFALYAPTYLALVKNPV